MAAVQKNAATAQAAGAKAVASQAGLWHSMARDAKDFSSHIFSATRSLLRWASLTGLISGVLGGGGLFGIERLAASAGGARRSALGLGVSPGEERAFGVNYSRITDPGQFLSGINAAKIDVGSDQFLALKALGIDGRKIQEEKTGDLAVETIQQLKKFVDKTPDGLFFGPTMNTMHADKLMSIDDLQRLKRTPAAEIEDYAKHYRADRQTLDLTGDQQKAWQDLQVQLHRAGESIENTFVKGLTPLAPAIEKLSGAFTKAVGDLLSRPELKEWIDKLSDGIKVFADYIGSDKFKTDVASFIKGVGDFATAVGTAFTTITGWIEWFNGKTAGDAAKNAGDALKNGGVNGPLDDDNPNAPGSPAFRRKRALERGEPDPTGPRTPWHMFGHSPVTANPTELHDYFASQGWKDYQIAGILANYQGESGLDAANVGDEGAAGGLGMWRDDRRKLYARLYGHDVTKGSPLEQAQFTQFELTHTEKVAGDALRNSTNARDAAKLVSTIYERPKDVALNESVRGNYGAQWDSQFAATRNMNQMKSNAKTVLIQIENNTGGNANVSASQLPR